jgi:hypothetical protein
VPNVPVAVTDEYVSADELALDDAEADAPDEEDDAQPARTATASRVVVASAAARRRRMETFRVWRIMSVCPRPGTQILGSG